MSGVLRGTWKGFVVGFVHPRETCDGAVCSATFGGDLQRDLSSAAGLSMLGKLRKWPFAELHADLECDKFPGIWTPDQCTREVPQDLLVCAGDLVPRASCRGTVRREAVDCRWKDERVQRQFRN